MSFNHLLLVQPEEPSIALQTAEGNDVANTIAPTPAANKAAVYALIRNRHPNWIHRKPLCGRYNCHGMTFANRRTAIYEDVEVNRIHADDGYRVIPAAKMPVPGDVAVYRNETVGILHSAVVVKPPMPLVEGGAAVSETALLLSKWGDSFGEDFHLANDYHSSGMPYTLEFWTDRP